MYIQKYTSPSINKNELKKKKHFSDRTIVGVSYTLLHSNAIFVDIDFLSVKIVKIYILNWRRHIINFTTICIDSFKKKFSKLTDLKSAAWSVKDDTLKDDADDGQNHPCCHG